jgi:hypothetical protein
MPHKPFPVSEWELAFIFPFGQKRSLSPHEFVLLSVTALVALYFVPKKKTTLYQIFLMRAVLITRIQSRALRM